MTENRGTRFVRVRDVLILCISNGDEFEARVTRTRHAILPLDIENLINTSFVFQVLFI